MRYGERTVPRLVGLLLSSVTTVCLVSSVCVAARAQADGRITKEQLLRSLKQNREEKSMDAATYVEMIKKQGVAFQMTADDEREIRLAGKYLDDDAWKRQYDNARRRVGKTLVTDERADRVGLDTVVAAVRDFYGYVRYEVFLFEYAPCEPSFKEFEKAILTNIIALPDKFSWKGKQYLYVKRLALVSQRKSLESQSDAEQYWRHEHVLQLIHGMCLRSDDGGVRIFSQVFLGDLHGPLSPTVRLKFKFDPEEFSDTKDIHSVLILYSLAQEAKARGLGKEVSISYLSEANEIAAQIKNTDAATLKLIRDVIASMLNELDPRPATLTAR